MNKNNRKISNFDPNYLSRFCILQSFKILAESLEYLLLLFNRPEFEYYRAEDREDRIHRLECLC